MEDITYGVDMGEPNGDKTALTIKVGNTLYTFVGEEAAAIIALIAKEREQAAVDTAKHIKKLMEDNNDPWRNHIDIVNHYIDGFKDICEKCGTSCGAVLPYGEDCQLQSTQSGEEE